jgi:hypothetical protein
MLGGQLYVVDHVVRYASGCYRPAQKIESMLNDVHADTYAASGQKAGNCKSNRRSLRNGDKRADNGKGTLLLGDFALGFVGGVFDLGFEAFEEAVEEGFGVGVLVLKLVGEGDVAGEVGEDDAPGEGVLPGSAADADVLALFGDPDAENLEGGFVALGLFGDC